MSSGTTSRRLRAGGEGQVRGDIGAGPRDEAEKAWRPVVEAINHFKCFDRYVVSSAMWNFGIPYRLKHYIDVLVQPSLTFGYSPEKGYTGLVTGRPMMLLLARGGVYRPGNPLETFDFQESYLRTIFGFIGFTDIRAVTIQGTLKTGLSRSRLTCARQLHRLRTQLMSSLVKRRFTRSIARASMNEDTREKQRWQRPFWSPAQRAAWAR